MSYAGSMKEIRFGQFGIVSDLASDAMPDGGLIRCENGQFLNGIVEKAEEISDWVRSNPTYKSCVRMRLVLAPPAIVNSPSSMTPRVVSLAEICSACPLVHPRRCESNRNL